MELLLATINLQIGQAPDGFMVFEKGESRASTRRRRLLWFQEKSLPCREA